MANLSKEKGLEPVPRWAFIGFNLHRNTGCVCVYTHTHIHIHTHICTRKPHQSLSGSNDQTIGNTQRTMRAYSESGSDSQRAMKLWETNSFYTWNLII